MRDRKTISFKILVGTLLLLVIFAGFRGEVSSQTVSSLTAGEAATIGGLGTTAPSSAGSGSSGSSSTAATTTASKASTTVTSEDIVKLIEKSVPQPAGSYVDYHRLTGQMVVLNTLANHEKIEGFLRSLRAATMTQISIEARIIEVKSFDGEDFGIELRGLTDQTLTDGSTAAGFAINAKNKEGRIDTKGVLDWEAGSWGDESGIGNPLSLEFAVLDYAKFKAIITALEKNKNTNTLSAPKLTCYNNQMANIKVVTEFSYVKDWDIVQTTSGDTSTIVETTYNPVIDTIWEGIVLEVVPVVNENRETITLSLRPSVREVDLTNTVDIRTESTDQARNVTLPQITTRTTQTTVSVEDGKTLVIGGLMKNEDVDNVRKVPFFGDIPILGKLFQSKTKYQAKSNLLIFITARILDTHGDMVNL
ncbi:MAG: hypothetical protein HQ593_02550 [Candidatus Omnitrophica bacterium]|nr:hypothetical protein [Candidatus Omnitrophota bacterium]